MRFQCRLRGVVLGTEMGEHEAFCACGAKSARKIGAVIVGKMPVARGNALLERIGVRTRAEHFKVVIALQNDGVTTGERGLHRLRNVTDVGGVADAEGLSVGDGELDAVADRALAIVRRGEGRYRDVSNRIRCKAACAGAGKEPRREMPRARRRYAPKRAREWGDA